MPKRTNPFGECSPLQLKSHIGAKEVDKCKEGSMNAVYEKTKAKLFEGSRKSAEDHCENSTIDDTEMLGVSPLQPLPGQLRLDSQGALCEKAPEDMPKEEISVSNTMDTDKNSTSEKEDTAVTMETEAEVTSTTTTTLLPGQMVIDVTGKIQKNTGTSVGIPPSSQCCTCNHGIAGQLKMCSDCGKQACVTSCIQQCYMCEQRFCRICLNPNPEDHLERPICNQCTV